jgi:hypothetical protein
MARILARMFHELLSRDHEDGRATGQPQGVGSEAYLSGTSQGPTPEDARKDGHIRGRSKRFMKYTGYIGQSRFRGLDSFAKARTWS